MQLLFHLFHSTCPPLLSIMAAITGARQEVRGGLCVRSVCVCRLYGCAAVRQLVNCKSSRNRTFSKKMNVPFACLFALAHPASSIQTISSSAICRFFPVSVSSPTPFAHQRRPFWRDLLAARSHAASQGQSAACARGHGSRH